MDTEGLSLIPKVSNLFSLFTLTSIDYTHIAMIVEEFIYIPMIVEEFIGGIYS